MPLVRLALQVHVEDCPLGLVNQGDQLLQVDRLAELGEGPCEDVSQDPPLLSERAQDLSVVIQEVSARALPESGPAATLGKGEALLVGELQEQEVGELLDIVAIVDPVVPQRIAESP